MEEYFISFHRATSPSRVFIPGINPVEDLEAKAAKLLLKFRTQRIAKSQEEFAKMFEIFDSELKKVNKKYKKPRTNGDDVQSEGTLSASEANESISSWSLNSEFSPDTDFIDTDIEENQMEHEFYPKFKITDSGSTVVVIGPNGTQLDAQIFQSLIWTTAAIATRSLLSHIFTPDILATHTLTGKPSPAFHGRERPPKMRLDPLITADIIHCVKAKINGSNERQVRTAITTKCADTAKKYKRRMLKYLKNNAIAPTY